MESSLKGKPYYVFVYSLDDNVSVEQRITLLECIYNDVYVTYVFIYISL